MAYRNGTYVAFHANGTNIPGESDISYYNLLKAWSGKGDDSFAFINSHDKVSAVRDSSKAETLRRSLNERLKNSRNMLLIIGDTTKDDDDWVPFEITKAVDSYKLPLIIAYTKKVINGGIIRNPNALSNYWPQVLKEKIEASSVNAIHIPFLKNIINDAIGQFNHNNPPPGKGLGIYSDDAYRSFGFIL
ncbi:TIR domain-containing protein [Dickeya fangzhongdai]|uniref:TIR domain-containing protein n=1 Tax=Dickeya fangzhongdai TaxID=1778540 RepID=UPI0026E01EAB|nr:TIR domain-containing protein [Dickeya fangzhongdai]WKV52158.1 TIR domain-containing protein [Dickeya fangzhongdai]